MVSSDELGVSSCDIITKYIVNGLSGGFYDHVSTPSTGVPAPEDALEDWTDDTAYFDFERLGVRIPTIAISPWIPKGTIISAAPSEQKPTDSSEYDLTSIMATVRKLFPEMDQSPLTNRDAWSSTFEHIFDNLTDPRSDCPEHLTDAMIPTPANDNEVVESNDAQNKAPLIDIQEDIARLHAHLTGVRVPEFVDQQTHSEWLTRHYQLHRSMTKNFDAHVKGNSETYRVEMLWKNNPAGSGEAESQWDINGIPHGAFWAILHIMIIFSFFSYLRFSIRRKLFVCEPECTLPYYFHPIPQRRFRVICPLLPGCRQRSGRGHNFSFPLFTVGGSVL